MSSPRIFSPRGCRNRRGLSFLEFVGCVLSLGSGVAIGSVYLGVDMKTLFVSILERAELVDPGFFGNKAVAQQAAASPTGDAEEPAKPIATNAESQIAEAAPALVAEATSPADATSPDELPAAEVAANGDGADMSEAERLAATLAYWKGLTASIAAEKEHRSPRSLDIENWQLFDYLTLRREGHRMAIEAIEQLDERGVDDRLLWHGRQVLSWHQAGAKLYGRAVDLLTDAPSDQLTGPYAQSWQSSATQHRMEEKLVREKHLSVAGYLDHTYKDHAPFQPAF